MTEIYLPFLFAHYGLYGNAPVEATAAEASQTVQNNACPTWLSRFWQSVTIYNVSLTPGALARSPPQVAAVVALALTGRQQQYGCVSISSAMREYTM